MLEAIFVSGGCARPVEPSKYKNSKYLEFLDSALQHGPSRWYIAD